MFIAFLLADSGYDVWCGNARGNTYSRSHVYLKPQDKKFWDYRYKRILLCKSRLSLIKKFYTEFYFFSFS